MGKPAARLTDMHVCPMSDGPKPHVGGPISGPGCPTVLIGGMPAARMGDMCVCVGPPDTIASGSTGVMIGGQPAARMGDQCVHGGKIVIGCPTVLIGEIMSTVTTPLASVAPGEVAKSSSSPAPLVTTVETVKTSLPTEEKKIEKSEIQFKLLDQEGKPISGENYKVILPDGSVRKGKTDAEGDVHLAGIDPGNCKISFPDIDGSAWA